MLQSLTINIVHLVYSTHGRRPWLGAELRADLWKYTASVLNAHDCPVFQVGGMEDHLHVLFSLSKNMRLSDAVREVKASSSRWMKTRGNEYAAFAWQSGYGAFSVSASNKARVVEYIANQEKHHAHASYQDELRALLRKHGVAWDERYLWD